MSLTLVAIVIALIAMLGGVVKAYTAGEEKCEATHAAAQAAADKAQKELTDKLKQEATNHVQDMETAFEAGQAKSRVVYLGAQTKGAADVQKHPEVFDNPACTLPPESLANVNALRSALFGLPANASDSAPVVRPTPAPSSGAATVPSPAAPSGREGGNAVPGQPEHHRPLGTVPGSAAKTP